jgi:hypothetical protein
MRELVARCPQAPRHRGARSRWSSSSRARGREDRTRSTSSPSSRRRGWRFRPRRRGSPAPRSSASSRSPGERPPRRHRAEDPALEVGARALVRAAHLREGTDLLVARALVQERLARAASQLPTTARPPVILAPLSSLEPRAEGRRLVRHPVADGAHRRGALDRAPAAHGRARRGQRRHLGAARPAAPGAGRPRPPEGPRRAPRRRAARRADATAARGGRLRRHPQPAPRGATRDRAVDRRRARRGARRAARGQRAAASATSPRSSRTTAPPIGDAIINDRPGLLLIVEKQPDANTVAVTRGVEAALAARWRRPPGCTSTRPSSARRASSSARCTTSARRWCIGCVLVALILGLFLYDARTALISALAIPLSLLAAALVLRRAAAPSTPWPSRASPSPSARSSTTPSSTSRTSSGASGSTARSRTPPGLPVVLEASLEVRSAVVYATSSWCWSSCRCTSSTGLPGAFFRPLAVAYGLGVLASMVVALTVTPALALLLVPRADLDHRESPLAAWLRARYARLSPASSTARGPRCPRASRCSWRTAPRAPGRGLPPGVSRRPTSSCTGWASPAPPSTPCAAPPRG